MASTTRKRLRPGAGRPPEGAGGEPVSGYPRITVRLPPTTKDTLSALSALRRVPVWKMIDLTIGAYVKTLPAAERRVVAQFTAKMDRA